MDAYELLVRDPWGRVWSLGRIHRLALVAETLDTTQPGARWRSPAPTGTMTVTAELGARPEASLRAI